VHVAHSRRRTLLPWILFLGRVGLSGLAPGPQRCRPIPVDPVHDPRCDDGSEPLCDLVPPVCAEGELLAWQDSCYRCVDPETCAPAGPTRCRSNADCAADEVCDPCGTSSCPVCDDCVPACVPWDPGAPDCSEFRGFQCGPDFTCHDGVVQGSWHEHVFDDNGVEDIVEYWCTARCENDCAAEYYESWPEDGAEVVSTLCR